MKKHISCKSPLKKNPRRIEKGTRKRSTDEKQVEEENWEWDTAKFLFYLRRKKAVSPEYKPMLGKKNENQYRGVTEESQERGDRWIEPFSRPPQKKLRNETATFRKATPSRRRRRQGGTHPEKSKRQSNTAAREVFQRRRRRREHCNSYNKAHLSYQGKEVLGGPRRKPGGDPFGGGVGGVANLHQRNPRHFGCRRIHGRANAIMKHQY